MYVVRGMIVTVVLSYGGNVAEVLPLQEEVYLCKAWSVCLLALPTLAHEVVDLPWTCGRPGDHLLLTVSLVPVVAVLYYLLIGHLRKRPLGAEHQDLPQRDGKGPDVALRCVLSLQS